MTVFGTLPLINTTRVFSVIGLFSCSSLTNLLNFSPVSLGSLNITLISSAVILSDFKTGKIKVVLNVGVLTTGFDFPELDCLILCRPTMSLSLYYQMIGRAVRPHKNKDYADIYDLCGNVKYFGRIETLRFIGDDNRRLGLSSDAQILIKPPKSFMQKVFTEKIQNQNAGSLILQTGKFAGKAVEEIFSNYKWYVDFCIEKNTSYKPIFEKYIAEMQEQAKQISNF
jgi:superfamily II DNA/RNA helicase